MNFSYLLRLVYLYYKVGSVGHPLRIELINKSLLIQLVNH